MKVFVLVVGDLLVGNYVVRVVSAQQTMAEKLMIVQF